MKSPLQIGTNTMKLPLQVSLFAALSTVIVLSAFRLRNSDAKFCSKPDFPEMLVAGRERAYLTAFMSDLAVNAAAVTDDLDEYVRCFSLPGGTRGHFGYYRAFDQDARDNRASAARKLTMPILLLGGEAGLGDSFSGQVRSIATNVRSIVVPNSGQTLTRYRGLTADTRPKFQVLFQT